MKIISVILIILTLNFVPIHKPEKSKNNKIDITAPIRPIEYDPAEPEIPSNNEIVDFYTERYYGAFSNEYNEMVTFVFSAIPSTHYFYVKYYNNRTDALLVNESYKLSDYVESTKRMEYTIKCKGKLTNDGLRIQFATGTSTSNLQKIRTVLLYPTNNQTIYSYQYVNEAFTTTNQIFQIAVNGVNQKESVRFQNTIDYLTNGADNSLAINEISFTYDEGFNLINKNTNKYLKILDLDNIFPYINKDENHYIYIPIKCLQNGVDISLEFNSEFYYDPKTLDISLSPRTGFKATDKFYIAKTRLKDLENATFAVEMNEFGRSKFNVIIPLTFIKDKNFLGMCGDANHCIVGGVKE